MVWVIGVIRIAVARGTSPCACVALHMKKAGIYFIYARYILQGKGMDGRVGHGSEVGVIRPSLGTCEGGMFIDKVYMYRYILRQACTTAKKKKNCPPPKKTPKKRKQVKTCHISYHIPLVPFYCRYL